MLTAFVHVGVARTSRTRAEEAAALETALIDALREAAPDLQVGEASTLHLRRVTQRLQDAGHAQALPERVWRLLRGIAGDGRGDGAGKGSLGLRRQDRETVRVTLQRGWSDLAETAQRRRSGAQRLLDHLQHRYQRLSMRNVDLGFAGRQAAGHPLHKAIAALSPGDALTPHWPDGRGELFNQAGQRVGRLAKGFKPPEGMRCHAAKVLAVVTWGRELSDPEYQAGVKCDAWQVVVPELTFAPDGG